MEQRSSRAAPSGSCSSTTRFVSRFAELGIDFAGPGNHNRAVPSGWRDFFVVGKRGAPPFPAHPCSGYPGLVPCQAPVNRECDGGMSRAAKGADCKSAGLAFAGSSPASPTIIHSQRSYCVSFPARRRAPACVRTSCEPACRFSQQRLRLPSGHNLAGLLFDLAHSPSTKL